RRLDRNFYCARPLFSKKVAKAYEQFQSLCFSTFNDWGQDALILSGAYRRRTAWQPREAWGSGWDEMFDKRDTDAIPGTELAEIRDAHDRVVAAIVRDLALTRARRRYT